jgi:hypothetical protein
MGRWMKNDWDGTCGVFIPEGVVVGKVAEPMGGRVTGRGGWSHNRLWKGEAYIFSIYLPMKMESVEGSETSGIRTKTPGKYPKENILHIEHGESLKSVMLFASRLFSVGLILLVGFTNS